jgi:hypothetical protein
MELMLLQDDAALSLFKRTLAGPNCTKAPMVCQLLASWQPYTAPCSASDCMPCLQPNVTDCSAVVGSLPYCRWSFIGCSQGRVSQLVLGEFTFWGWFPAWCVVKHMYVEGACKEPYSSSWM